MDKMMHPKEQDRRQMDETIDKWFQHHFHNVSPTSALGASLEIAKQDLRKMLGITSQPTQGDNA